MFTSRIRYISQPHKAVLFAFGLFFSMNSFGDSLDYRWLETHQFQFYQTFEQGQWFEKQEALRADYEKSIGQDWVQKEFEDHYSKDKVLQEEVLNNGKKVELVLHEGGLGQKILIDGEVLLESWNTPEPLKKLGLYSGNISDFKVSPNQKYLVISFRVNGSSLEAQLILFDLNAMKFLDVLSDIFGGLLAWVGPTKAQYYDQKSGSYFEYNAETQKIELVRNSEGLNSSSDGRFLFSSESESETTKQGESETRTFNWQKIHIKTYDGSQVASLSFRDKGMSWSSYIGHTESYFVFADSNRNIEKILLLPYDFDQKGHLTIGRSLTYEPIQAGAIQNLLVNKQYMIAAYMAGPFKTYHLFDKNGELFKILNSPIGGALESFRHIEGKKFEFTFASSVVDSYSFIHDFSYQDWMPDEINRHLMKDSNGTEYVSRFQFVKAKDGVSVPIRLTHRKELQINAQTPLLINAYGGHGIVGPFRPRFELGNSLFLREGGVIANPAVRGGGEYGAGWYHAAKRTLTRYDDTEVCIKELHRLKIGSPNTTAFEGWSNGGLLAGVMLTHHPELFKLVISGNGLHDMEREEVLDHNTDKDWKDEWGGYSTKSEVEFLRSYSPFLKAQERKVYPTAYIIAGVNDRRVHPAHSYKLVAALQDSQLGSSPILLHRFQFSGHWPTSPEYMGLSGLNGAITKWKVLFSELGMKGPKEE